MTRRLSGGRLTRRAASFFDVRILAAASLTLAVWVAPARAVTLDDYLAHGFAVVAQTTVAGLFSGCRLGLAITFSDGSQFICAQNASQAGYNTRAVFLAYYGAYPSVLLIGSRAYSGSLRQLGGRVFATPLQIGDAPPVGGAAPPTVDPVDVKLPPLNPIPSINELQSILSKPLNVSQAEPLPARGPPARKQGQ